MTDQNAFIAKVTAALGHPRQTARRRQALLYPSGIDKTGDTLARIRTRAPADRLELLHQLVERGKPLNLHVIPTKDLSSAATAITELVDKKSPEWEGPKSVAAWQHPLVDALDLEPLLSARQVAYFTALPATSAAKTRLGPAIRQGLETAFVGITSADYCLAETATLVLKTGPARARAVSLLPTIHVAVIELRQVIGNLAELFALLKSGSKKPCYGLGNCLTLITGPSKTADIELTMVHGAHGPREVYLYVITPEAVE